MEGDTTRVWKWASEAHYGCIYIWVFFILHLNLFICIQTAIFNLLWKVWIDFVLTYCHSICTLPLERIMIFRRPVLLLVIHGPRLNTWYFYLNICVWWLPWITTSSINYTMSQQISTFELMGPVQPAACFCRAHKLRLIFKFFNSWNKSKEIYFITHRNYTKFNV